jgi:oligopeptide/dipeptide ABC transporter ATP-binding protein
MTAAPPVLAAEGLRVVFRSGARGVTAVDGVSIAIQAGETVGIVGESGSGKSTFARALLGLLPGGAAAAIEAGRISAGGVAVPPQELKKLRGRTAAMVFQDPLSYLNPLMTVGKQIAEAVCRHDPKVPLVPRIIELLDWVKLPASIRNAYPHELSGGMRQRVLLAIALGCRPKLLIADEPTTALDITTQEEILALIRDIVTRLNMALLLISHDLGVVGSLCQRLNVMYRGRIVEYGATADIFSAPRHPYTRGLLKAAHAARDEQGYFATMELGDLQSSISLQGCSFAQRCEEASERCLANAPPALKAFGTPGHFAHCWRLTDDVSVG